MGQCYGQLSLEERIEIYRLHVAGESKQAIASALDRHASTIGRELRRNSQPSRAWAGGYEPVRAHQLAERRLRWDIPQSRSLADWRWSMVASSSAMSQSIVSSIIVRPRRITGTACCRATNSDADAADAQAAAPPTSSNNGARSPNAPPRSRAAAHRAIGKPTSCCSPDMAKGCLFSTNDKPASASFSSRSIEKLSSPLGPSPVNSANFRRRCAKPSASTTEPSSPSTTGFTKRLASKPSSAIPIVLGKKAAWKTPSGAYDAHCHAKPTSSSSRQSPSGGMFNASTTPHANVWTSGLPQRHSPNSNQSLHFKRDSICPLSRA